MIEHMVTPIHGANLSQAWAKAFVECWKARGQTLSPAVVSFDVKEDDPDWTLEQDSVRVVLERELERRRIVSVGQSNIMTVASTIFPENLWLRCRGDRQQLYKNYETIWPRVKKCSQNCHGVYFRRLTAFGDSKNPVNQLETIITTWNQGVHRHSALQAGIFDPLQDHKAVRQRGFPCLQQVAFHPSGTNGQDGLGVVAFYATQLLLEKAYGNYLGLYWLGRFMAKEMGIRLAKVTCIAADLKLSGDAGKGECESLYIKLQYLTL